jgi:hypothetical protein
MTEVLAGVLDSGERVIVVIIQPADPVLQSGHEPGRVSAAQKAFDSRSERRSASPTSPASP